MLGHGREHNALGNYVDGKAAFEQAQPLEQFRKHFADLLRSSRFAHIKRHVSGTAALVR